MRILDTLLDRCSAELRLALVQADLIPQLIVTLNTLSLSFTKAIDIHIYLFSSINKLVWLVTPEGLEILGIQDENELQAVHETIFQQVVAPSEQYICNLCMHRFSIFDGDQSKIGILSRQSRSIVATLSYSLATTLALLVSGRQTSIDGWMVTIADRKDRKMSLPNSWPFSILALSPATPSHSPLPLPHHQAHRPTPLCLSHSTNTLPLPSASLSPPTPSLFPLPLPHHPHPPTPLCLSLTTHALPLPSASPIPTLGLVHADGCSFDVQAHAQGQPQDCYSTRRILFAHVQTHRNLCSGIAESFGLYSVRDSTGSRRFQASCAVSKLSSN
ncbi:hypothetical protein BLNAU_19115 [Blattamonas nauphoetae]|uniref:Uncharacterized protein n=1 Tax=Blattamonas nauphoetae TaxID=2049346 RepID=A0ABQ9X5Q8_9EUKA|nr:hypothetical protein BLNAU_19115 [Blattamonas nauphoetae]